MGFGGVNPTNNKIDTENNGSSSGLTGMGGTASNDQSSTGASSPFGGGDSSAPLTDSASGSGGGAGGGGSASLPGSAAPAVEASKDGNYELQGGGGGLHMVGLKPSKSDLADISDDAAPSGDAEKLEDLGEREPANEAGSDDMLMQDSESIFLRVRAKYGTLKGAGRI